MTLSFKALVFISAMVSAGLALPAAAQEVSPEMSFFVSSVGLGDGANLGGLEGADAHCQALAEAAGAGDRTWAAYLSTQGEGAVHARDRIGSGPWVNAQGTPIAGSVEELHSETNGITKETPAEQDQWPEQERSRSDGLAEKGVCGSHAEMQNGIQDRQDEESDLDPEPRVLRVFTCPCHKEQSAKGDREDQPRYCEGAQEGYNGLRVRPRH